MAKHAIDRQWRALVAGLFRTHDLAFLVAPGCHRTGFSLNRLPTDTSESRQPLAVKTNLSPAA
jgi:hypothetical protein